MKGVYAATVRFNVLEVYNVTAPIKIFDKPLEPFFNQLETQKQFKKLAKKLYFPTLQLFLNQKIKVNLILTGHFLDQAEKAYPKLLRLIRKLIHEDLVCVVADSYYGEDYCSIYNSSWWSKSVDRSLDKINKLLHIEAKTVYLPQLFRNLELERLLELKKIKTFLLRQKGKKFLTYDCHLSELRRFNGKTVSWINSENDAKLFFNFIPDNLFFNINGNIFQPDLDLATKTFALAVAFASSEYEIKKETKKLRTISDPIRINEKPVYNLLCSMEKATLRLWEYGLRLILNKFHLEQNQEIAELLENYGRLQNTDFFLFLSKSNFLTGKTVTNFSSPFEAFVVMQTRVKQVEVLIKNQLV